MSDDREEEIQAALRAYEAELRGEPEEEETGPHPADVIADAIRELKDLKPEPVTLTQTDYSKAASGIVDALFLIAKKETKQAEAIDYTKLLKGVITAIDANTQAQKDVAKAILTPKQVMTDDSGAVHMRPERPN